MPGESTDPASAKSIQRFHARYQTFVRRSLRRVGVRESDLDDLAQEVFYVALRKARDLGDDDRLHGWLFQVVRRVASNERRARLRREQRHWHSRWSTPASTEGADPELAAMRREAEDFVVGFLESLDESGRDVFLLSEVQGLPGPEIARRLDANLNTTYARIRAVRRRFDEAVERERTACAGWVVGAPMLLPRTGAAAMLGLGLATLRSSLAAKVVLAAVAALVLLLGFGSRWRSPEPTPDLAGPIDFERRADRAARGDAERSDGAAAAFSGGATITGRVTDLDGRAIAGAHVCAKAIPADVHVLAACTKAADDGRYVLEHLPATVVGVTAAAEGYIAPAAYQGRRHRRVQAVHGSTIAGVDLVLQPGGRRVEGIVRDVLGGAVEEASVSVGSDSISAVRTTTDASGRFALWVDASSFVDLWVSADGYVAQSVTSFQPSGVFYEVVLHPESAIEGRVITAETGAPVAGARVDLGLRPHFARVMFGSAPPTASAITDADGRFRLVVPRSGRYKPAAVGERRVGQSAVDIEVGVAETIDGVEIVVHPGIRVSGSVSWSTGAACAYGRVALFDLGEQPVAMVGLDGAGIGTFDAVLPGVYRVRAGCEDVVTGVSTLHDVGEEFLVVEDDDVEGRTWVIEPAYDPAEGVRLEGRVVDSSGRGLPFARVEAVRQERLDDGSIVGPLTSTERDGSFAFDGLLTGTYDLGVEALGFVGGTWTTVVVDGAQDAIEIRLEATGTLRVQTVDPGGSPVGRVEVYVSTGGLGGMWLTTDAQGWTEAADMAPGEHTISTSRPGVGGKAVRSERAVSATATVAAGATAEVTVTVPARSGVIRGRVVRSDGEPVGDADVTVRSRWTYQAYGGTPRTSEVAGTRGDAQGWFEVGGLETERYDLVVRDVFGLTTTVEAVDVGSQVEVVLASPGSLRGSISVPGQASAPRFTVTVSTQGGGSHSEEFLFTDGQWSMAGLAPGRASVVVTAPEGSTTASVVIPAGGEPAPLAVELAPRGRLRARMIDDAGSPVSGAWLLVMAEHAATSTRPAKSGADGWAELSVPSGPFTLKVLAPPGFEPLTTSLEIPPGRSVELDSVVLGRREGE